MAFAHLLQAVLVVAFACICQAQELTFRYDPEYAAGVSGVIRVRYEPTRRSPSRAIITADLDFSRVTPETLKLLDERCPRRAREYEWHIHTKWTAPQSSGSFGECSARATGGHYDPTRVCGPDSEFAMTRSCSVHMHPYRCTPSRYLDEPQVCERGDLSGKLGNLILDRDLRIRDRWVDNDFPSFSEVSRQRSIVLHPVCGRETPRLACARVRQHRENE